MNVLKTLSLVALAGLSGLCYATAQEPQRVIAHPGVNNARPADARSLKWKVAVGRFSNETQYGKGIFYERDNDPMAKQALDILMTKLNASGKFILLERSDSEKLEAELKAGQGQRIGADYLILGSITEFGRKMTGRDGLFTSEKSQTVEAGVSIRIVDVATGQVIYSEEGKGQAQTTSKSTLGLGGKAGYDATLSDKAISGAIDQLVENIINADADGIIIAGGAAQGIRPGDTFTLYKRGKQVKNPQTGVSFYLAGKPVAQLRVESVDGDTPDTQYAIVSVVSGSFDKGALDNYYVQQ